MYQRSTGGRGCNLSMGRILIGLAIAAFSLFSYFSTQSQNTVTGETQHVDMTVNQEIAMGLQAAPEMESQFGGEDPNQQDQAIVDQIGQRIVQSSPAGTTDYQFDYHLLADNQTINAFALPGGQIFITRALYDLLTNEDELAGVLGHETGHVVARHSAEQIAKTQLTEGLTGAAVIASYDPNNPSTMRTAQVAMVIGQLINMSYGRQDELEADTLGVCFMQDAGYDPNQLINVMQILDQASQGNRPPEFLSTHPDPGNRIQRIQDAIANSSQCPGR